LKRFAFDALGGDACLHEKSVCRSCYRQMSITEASPKLNSTQGVTASNQSGLVKIIDHYFLMAVWISLPPSGLGFSLSLCGVLVVSFGPVQRTDYIYKLTLCGHAVVLGIEDVRVEASSVQMGRDGLVG
jgi:hypothetical protein